MKTVAIRAKITGRVQGVSFRAWTRAEAERRGLTGWVRNEPDGSVHALVMGPASDVAEMLRVLGNGPSHARVTEVLTEEVEPSPGITDFQVTR